MASARMFEYLRVLVAAHLMSLAAMLAVFERDHFQLSLSTYAISNQLELTLLSAIPSFLQFWRDVVDQWNQMKSQ